MQPYLVLGALAVVGIIAHNMTVTYSALLIMILKFILPEDKLLFFGSHGMEWGIILLMAAMFTPMATGNIGFQEIIAVFRSPVGIASLFIGVLVALFGRWGVEYMTQDPEIVASLIIGRGCGQKPGHENTIVKKNEIHQRANHCRADIE